MSLSPEARAALLRLARETLTAYFAKAPLPAPAGDERLQVEVARQQGAFVSLHRGDELRGCVGTFREDTPLWRVVQEMAIAAARNDTRFAPVTEPELPEVRLEISVLSPRRPITEPLRTIEIGRHGLWMERGLRRGVLLPQVAPEHGMDTLAFLEATCRKAGLSRDAWRDAQTTICVFEADVFHE